MTIFGVQSVERRGAVCRNSKSGKFTKSATSTTFARVSAYARKGEVFY